MKDIFIIQMHTGTLPSIIIKYFTKYEYSHVLLATDISFKKMYSFGRKKLYNPLNAGFVIEDINGNFFKRFSKTTCRIYRLTIPTKKYNKVIELLNDFESNEHIYKYDIIGLVFKLISFPLKRENHYVCTQFVAEILKKADIHDFHKSTALVKPRDFENINSIKEIYTGLLKEKNC